ncbi:MAG: succinate dehydrogenase, hydrophobic membrane anchor protein [Candidatus Abyssobacteria bacterium SURF_17]|uniref:Succinate dehydrogenase cytochrome b556 subunit n=1 Tax=Candidatus Abyssobacteria bacterium SURF_17 TaxID=2093361 RepID=A0A419F2C7_9BACT|nr:MAG: succinate dehydrogenase, hydrophobic membrane anchor protein [Candidatus Abyssubacteria bacterium SURF_17]
MAQQHGLWPWLLQRVTGLYLVFGMAVHIIVLPLSKEAITFESVAARLQSPWWVLFDFSLLSVCVYHGFNGLWSVFLDFNPSERLRQGFGWVLALFGLIWVVFGIFVLVPFTK